MVSQQMAKRLVWRYNVPNNKTVLTKDELKLNKRGRVVSKAQSDNNINNTWISSIKQAKHELGIDPNKFVLIKRDSDLYKKAIKIKANM